MSTKTSLWRPFLWVPSLYLAMGIPFNVINGTTSTMFKSLGLSDGQITSSLGYVGIAWSLKPVWAAFLDMYRTKKFFVLTMEILLAAMFVGVAMCLPMANFFKITIALLWVASFASSTQDICGDGIYLTALTKKAQSTLAGVQGAFWNLGKVLATGWLINGMTWLATAQGWSQQKMWMAVWITTGSAMLLFALYHVVLLPTGSVEHRPTSAKQVLDDFLGSATTFFHKRAFWGMIAFVFLYRMGEGLILTEGKLFMQSTLESGGLGLDVSQVSSIDAVYGTAASIIGGILGGLYLGRLGLRNALPIFGLCLNIPHFTFVYLSHYGASHHGLPYSTIAFLVSIEKFGYGFGFIGNMVYMMQQIAPGRCTMTHYAFATSLMQLMLVPTTMISGPLAEMLGFSTFFFVVMFASVPSALAAWRAPFPQKDSDSTASGHTIDDPTRLTPVEQSIQRIAGRASLFAMLNILMILIADAGVLGFLQGKAAGSGAVQLGFGCLLLFVGIKLYFATRTFSLAAEATAIAGPVKEKNYLGNANGAKIATLISLAVTIAVVAFAAHMAF